MGCLCNTSLSIKLPSPLQGKVKWISTNHNAMPALSQGPLLLLISPSQHGHQSPKRNFGRPGAPVASWSRGPWIPSVPAGALQYQGGSAGGREPSQTLHPPASPRPGPQQRPVGALLATAPVPCHSGHVARQGGRHPQLLPLLHPSGTAIPPQEQRSSQNAACHNTVLRPAPFLFYFSKRGRGHGTIPSPIQGPDP